MVVLLDWCDEEEHTQARAPPLLNLGSTNPNFSLNGRLPNNDQ
jgi:hypothetical protein